MKSLALLAGACAILGQFDALEAIPQRLQSWPGSIQND